MEPHGFCLLSLHEKSMEGVFDEPLRVHPAPAGFSYYEDYIMH